MNDIVFKSNDKFFRKTCFRSGGKQNLTQNYLGKRSQLKITTDDNAKFISGAVQKYKKHTP